MGHAGHAFLEVDGGGIIYVTLGEFTGVHKNCASCFQEIGSFGDAVHAGLRGTAQFSMVMMRVRNFRLRGHPGEIAGKRFVRPLFLPIFLFSRNSLYWWWW